MFEHDLVLAKEQLDSLHQHLAEQDREIGSLNRQLEISLRERDTFASDSMRHAEEARNTGSDLMAVAKENQMLHSEITEVSEYERNNLQPPPTSSLSKKKGWQRT